MRAKKKGKPPSKPPVKLPPKKRKSAGAVHKTQQRARGVHKTPPRVKPGASGRVPMETKTERLHGTWGAGVTYQREYVLCGKAKCAKLHGPYWYAYVTSGGRKVSIYVGRELDRGKVRDRLVERFGSAWAWVGSGKTRPTWRNRGF